MSSHGGGGDRWLVSYSDFITLLMVMFVVLYSMGQIDLKRYKEMAKSFQSAFSVGGGGAPVKVVDPGIDKTSGISTDKGQPVPIVVEGLPKSAAGGVEVAGKLTDLLNKSNLAGEVSIQNNVEGSLISLSEKLVFNAGTADLVPDAYPILDTIADMLRPMENEIRVVGNTDNSPPTGYKDNWELSFARAYKIVSYLESKGISPKRLMASGRGEFSPIFPNDTPQHRVLNNRAEIIIVYPQATQDVINLQQPLVSPTTNPGVQGGKP